MYISLDGPQNFRDLNPHAHTVLNLAGERTLVPQAVFRSDALHNLDGHDIQALKDLDVKTVIDLRSDGEQAHAPDTIIPGVQNIHLPIDPGNLLIETIVADPTSTPQDTHDQMLELYKSFVSDTQVRQQFARALTLIAEQEIGRVVFHCASGKDRTGWLL